MRNIRCINLCINAIFLLFFIGLASCDRQNPDLGQVQNPNIIYILADDMGYGDISSLNPESGIQTPHIDRLVASGIHFTDFHTNSSVCTPTRYGTLTGRYAWRSRLKSGVLWGYDPPLIESDRTTVASFLKSNGYHTACIGKWHLGLGWVPKDQDEPIGDYDGNRAFPEGGDSNVDFSKKASGPSELGFDYSFIIPASLDMTPYLYLEDGKAVELPTAFTPGKSQDRDGRGVFWRAGEVSPGFQFERVLETITEKSVTFIRDQKNTNQPFFLYFPLTAPHTPWLPIDDFNGRSNAGRYGAFVAMVDNAVGKIVETLEKSGLMENTLLIVTSDNGAHWTPGDKEQFDHRANFIYKGQKADIYEAGHRVPYVAYWKNVIPAGSSSDALMCSTDLMATLSGLINEPLPQGAGEDSYNLWQNFVSPSIDHPVRSSIIHHSLDGIFSIRQGKWKYTPHLGSGGFSNPKSIEPKQGEAPGTLFDLESDPRETDNLYFDHPEIVTELAKLLNNSKSQYHQQSGD
jgi:arylsulfatase A-like enzyme